VINPRPLSVTAAIMIDDSGSLLLARRPAGDRLAGHWELPGGKVEAGESPEACLARELLEEFGIVADVGQLFAENIHVYPHAAIQLLVYRVDRWSGEIELRAHDDVRWVALDEIDELNVAPADVPILRRLRDELC
jgi:8-oxo-dGTP diphosphatase